MTQKNLSVFNIWKLTFIWKSKILCPRSINSVSVSIAIQTAIPLWHNTEECLAALRAFWSDRSWFFTYLFFFMPCSNSFLKLYSVSPGKKKRCNLRIYSCDPLFLTWPCDLEMPSLVCPQLRPKFTVDVAIMEHLSHPGWSIDWLLAMD